MTRPRRTDANHAEIRNGLRQCGYSVFDSSRFGYGLPDLIVNAHGRIVFLEIKTGEQGLTPMEALFAMTFPVSVVRSLDDALMVVASAAAPPPC